MNTIKYLKRVTKFGSTYDVDSLASPLDKLALFLLIEGVCFGSARLTRLINTLEDGEETSGNMMIIEKRNENAYIRDVYHNGLESERKHFVIPISDLINLMESWDKLMEEKPEEISLISEDGKFELIGNNVASETTIENIEC